MGVTNSPILPSPAKLHVPFSCLSSTEHTPACCEIAAASFSREVGLRSKPEETGGSGPEAATCGVA